MAGKRRGMTNEQLETYLKDTRYVRDLKNYLSEMDKKNTKKIKAEFEKRRIKLYESEAVDADITTGESESLNMKKVLEEFSVEELYRMGVFKPDAKKFKKKAGIPKEEIKRYITKKAGKKQLNIRPKPEVSEELIEEISEKISHYPTSANS